MAGRKPVPTAIKRAKGNPGKRKINNSEPKPRTGKMATPAHLSDEAQLAWAKLAPILKNMGVFTEADTYALERLCECYAEILACQKLIEDEGRIYKSTGSNGVTLIKNNPAVSQLRSADAQFRGYLTDFGLTPASRTKIQINTDEEKDELDKFFN